MYSFSCGENTITLKATDIALSIKTEMNAQIEKQGDAAIPCPAFYMKSSIVSGKRRYLQQRWRKFSRDQLSEFKGRSPAMDAAEFPVFPELQDEEQIKIQQNVLRAMINQTPFAAAVNEDKPILTGLLFDIKRTALLLLRWMDTVWRYVSSLRFQISIRNV